MAKKSKKKSATKRVVKAAKKVVKKAKCLSEEFLSHMNHL